MKTKIYTINDNDIMYEEAAKVINSGGLIVFPTETVYGIGADAFNKNAAQKIFAVKGRPADNPLIVHIADKKDLKKCVQSISDDAELLIESFWPGPLTLVFKKTPLIPDEITAGLNTVAIRMPNNDIALKLIENSNTYICAPSANISGRPSSTIFEHVVEDLYGKVDIIIDGGKSTIGLESTVLDLTSNQPTILRPGAITKSMLEQCLNKTIKESTNITNDETPKSPGMKYTHYSPIGKITVVFGEQQKIINYINNVVNNKENTAVICAREYFDDFISENKFIIGSLDNPNEVASNLFIILRQMDHLGIKEIFIHALPEDKIGFATMNRLLKAAGNNIVNIE